jgi:hypothetical protein
MSSRAKLGKLYFFGGTVNPKIEICPDPATFKPPDSSGLGK